MAAYTPPSWSTAPQHASWALEVIKDGAVVEKLAINEKPFYLLGRQPDAVDIILAHESISRVHAALQFDERGQLYVCDLGSTHGTKLNSSKEKLKPRAYSLCPSGSVLRFGESTRLYCVLGPADFSLTDVPLSESKEAFVEASEARQARKAREKEEAARQAQLDEERKGITLGNHGFGGEVGSADDGSGGGSLLYVDEDGLTVDGIEGTARTTIKRLEWLDEIRDPSSSSSSSSSTSSKSQSQPQPMTERDREILDRLRAKMLKLKSYCHEIDRVKGKDKEKKKPKLGRAAAAGQVEASDLDSSSSSLTDAQRSQLARLEDAIEKILTPLENDEELLRERLRTKNLLSAATLRKLEACDEARLKAKGAGFAGNGRKKIFGGESKEAAYLAALAGDEEVEDATDTIVVVRSSAAGAARPAFKFSKASSISANSNTTAKPATAAAAIAAGSAPAASFSKAPASSPSSSFHPKQELPSSSDGDLASVVPSIFGSTSRKAHTFESLFVALEELRGRIDMLEADFQQQLQQQQQQQQQEGDGSAGAAASSSSSADDLDDYLKQNEATVAREALVEKKRRFELMKRAETRLEAMMELAKPPPPPPPPPQLPVEKEGPEEEEEEEEEQQAAAAPPAKRPRLEAEGPQPLPFRAAAPAGLAALLAGEANPRPSSASHRPLIMPARPGPAPEGDPDLAWVPPTGQRGDGRTALNDKLGY